MSTPEDIEIAKQANAAVIAREGTALTGDSYGVPAADLTFDTPMVIEGQLPNFVPVAEAEGVSASSATPYADGTVNSFTGPADPFNQSWVDFRVRQVTGPDPVQEPFTGPMSLTPDPPEPLSDFGVDAFDPTSVYDPEDKALTDYMSLYDDEDEDDTDGPGPTFESTAKSPYGGGVSKTPYADAESAKTLEEKKKAAKALVTLKLTKEVFDTLSPKEQESEILQMVGAQEALEGVGEATGIETTEGLAPSAVGAAKRAGVPAAQSMAAKGPLSPTQELDRIEVEKRQLAVKAIDQQIVSMERLDSRKKVAAAEADVVRETKVKESDASFDELKAAMGEVGNFEVDRDRYWNSKSTGLKIATALSLMLSAYAHAKSGRGGVDPALQMMMRAVDKDVSDQVMEYNSKVAGVGRKKTLYSMFRQRLGDHDRAKAATELSMLRGVQSDMLRQEMKTKSQMAKLQLQEARQKIRLREQGLLGNFRPKNFREQLAQDKHEYQKGQDTQERTTSIRVNGKFLMAPTPKQAQAASKIHVERNIFKDQLIGMKSAIKKLDVGDLLAPWTTSVSNELLNRKADMTGSFRNMVSPGGGVLSDEDRKQIDKINKDLTKLFSIDNILGAAGAISIAEESMDQFMKYADMRANQEIQSLTIGYQTPRQRSGIQRGDYRTNRRR